MDPIEQEERVITLERLELGSGEGKKRREYSVRLVRAGRVRAKGNRLSNIEIPAAPLKAAVEAGMFNSCASFLDHAGWLDYPSLRNLVGVIHSVEWNETDQSVDGVIRLYEGEASDKLEAVLDGILQDRENGEPTPDVGLSMIFWPKWKPRDNYEDPLTLAEIKHVESCDFVFEPGADGRVKARLAAQDGQEPVEPAQIQSGGTMSDQTTEQAGAEWVTALGQSAARSIISTSGLPLASREKLLDGSYETPQAVEAAIEAERAYLARLQEDQVVNLAGPAPRSPQISMGLTGIEQIEQALEALIAGANPPSGVQPLSGIREAYMLLSGDYEMTGLFHADRVYLANVSSATMPGLVANALNKRVVNLFQQYPRWWEKIVQVEDFSTLQQVKWITLGGVGELPTVAEGAAYTELNWADLTETADFIKKGGYLGITLEAMDKDDTRKLQAAPRALAQAAWLTLSKSISGIFTSNGGVGPTLSDAKPLFHVDHINLGTTALSFAAWAAVRAAMRKQSELGAAERLGALTAPKYLLVPPDLEITALQILASEGQPGGPNNDENPFAEGNEHDARMRAAKERVVVVDLWEDINNWAAVADPRLYPSIGLGFRYGRVPEIFSVASPTAGLMFTHDTMPVKARFFYAVGPTDYRGLYKQNVA